MEKIKLRGERWPWRNGAWMRRIIYCPQVLRWFVWMLKGLDYDKMAGAGGVSSGSHWKGLCHVLEVSRVSFKSYIQIVTVMNSVISGTLVQVKSMKKSHSFPTEAFRLQVSYSGSTGGLYRNLLDYRHKNRQMKKDISLLKITVWIKYIFTVSLEKYEINCNTQK